MSTNNSAVGDGSSAEGILKNMVEDSMTEKIKAEGWPFIIIVVVRVSCICQELGKWQCYWKGVVYFNQRFI